MLNLQRQAVPQHTSPIRKARTSNIAKVDFLQEDLSHELRTKLRPPQTTAAYRTCSLNQNFRTELEGPQTAP